VLSSSHFRCQAPPSTSRRQRWNYLSRMMSCNFEDLTPSTAFRDLFLATNLWQWDYRHNYLMCIQRMNCDKPHKKSNDVRPSDYLCCISFRNMNCSNWRNSCIGVRHNSIFAENEHQLLPEPTEQNLLWPSTCSFIVLMHVPHQMISTFVHKLQHFYA